MRALLRNQIVIPILNGRQPDVQIWRFYGSRDPDGGAIIFRWILASSLRTE
jgi:hypothetical protein